MSDNGYNELREPLPPIQYQRTAEHHWLDVFDIDGHFHETVVLQYNPGAIVDSFYLI